MALNTIALTTVKKTATLNEITTREVVEPVELRAPVEAPRRDVLGELVANVAMLEDLSGRLRFMMSELRSIVK